MLRLACEQFYLGLLGFASSMVTMAAAFPLVCCAPVAVQKFATGPPFDSERLVEPLLRTHSVFVRVCDS
jgi:hypothetical protein